MQTAILIHCLGWESQSTEVDLEAGLKLCRTEGTKVEKLYHKLCKRNEVDQGDPFYFPTHILIDDSMHDDLFPYWGGPHSIVSICCNLISICISQPLSMCRLITSKDNFRTSWVTSTIYEASEDSDIIRARPKIENFKGNDLLPFQVESIGDLGDSTIHEIGKCLKTISEVQNSNKTDNHRIDNALNYFFYAWRSYHLEQVCLNLAIVLESLFSPSQAQELSHQIAFNTAHFIGNEAKDKEQVYKTIKQFYNLRSQIVHGGKAKERDLFLLTPEVFHLCAFILKKILSSDDLAMCFSSEKARSEIVRTWMFGASA